MLRVGEPVLGQQRRQPLARAWREGGDDHAPALALQGAHVLGGRVEHVEVGAVRSGAKLRPTRPWNERTVAARHAPGACSNGVMQAHDARGQQLFPLLAAPRNMAGRRHRLVGRRAEGQGLQPLHARIVVVAIRASRSPTASLGQVIEADGGVRHVVEQRIQVIVEQRQPVLHARIALAGADGLVERVLAGHGAEGLHVAARGSASRPRRRTPAR